MGSGADTVSRSPAGNTSSDDHDAVGMADERPEPLPVVFSEPSTVDEGPLAGLAAWYRSSSSTEAQAARQEINRRYAAFPDRGSMVVSRLRGSDDTGVQQALDELYIHSLLSRSYICRYEEDGTSPDFRLYRPSEYVAGIEAFTLFPEAEFTSEYARNQSLVDEVRRRVTSKFWFVSISIVKWSRQPRVTDVARWLERKIAALPDPGIDLSHKTYPSESYVSPEVELSCTFLPRSNPSAASDQTPPIGVLGPTIGGFYRPATRLRRNISKKVGKYDLRSQPFAIAICVRDFTCDTDDIIDALYGDSVVSYHPISDSTNASRNYNGTFGRSTSAPSGRNRRISSVFVLMRGWMPGSNNLPTVMRLDNPFANASFPEDMIETNARYAPVRNQDHIRMEWTQTPP